VKPLSIRTFVAPAFGQNSYLLHLEDGTAALAIDPGAEASAMAEILVRERLVLDAILLTHAHLDHIEGVASLVRATGAPTYMHPDDRLLYEHVVQQGLQFGLHVEPQPPVDHALAHGQRLTLAGIELEVRHVPGHSPGHVIFYCAAGGAAFVGDTVFQGSIGRSDLPGGDFQQLIRAIRDQLLTLPPETLLYSGHGPATTVAHEAKTNPFLIPHYGGGGFA
jgi:glyoxylase-like metal-dependent hydrolase (beta-lactamase superfamily II)